MSSNHILSKQQARIKASNVIAKPASITVAQSKVKSRCITTKAKHDGSPSLTRKRTLAAGPPKINLVKRTIPVSGATAPKTTVFSMPNNKKSILISQQIQKANGDIETKKTADFMYQSDVHHVRKDANDSRKHI